MFKKNVLKLIVAISLYSQLGQAMEDNPVQKFDEGWKNPANTSIRLRDVNINDALASSGQPITLTRDDLWDAERKKAFNPEIHISNVVKESRTWGYKKHPGDIETFYRYSMQKQWITDDYAEVLEFVYLLNREQQAYFFGLEEAEEDGKIIRVENSQPLFHVLHGVEGTMDTPLNVWKFVHLTEEPSEEIRTAFSGLQNPAEVPYFVNVYLSEGLKASK